MAGPEHWLVSLYILNLELNDVSATSYEEPVTKNFEHTGLTKETEIVKNPYKLD